jgi:MFS family permease
MVGFGIGPIIGSGIGGLVYQSVGSTALFVGASALAVSAGAVAWFALSTPALSEPMEQAPSLEPVAAPEQGPFP